MATYNGERYLKEQINSILMQLDDYDELVISDDGSTDATLKIIKSYLDCRIRFFSNCGKHGVTWNFENALKQVKGDYIFLSDQDDVWLPNKIEYCLTALQNNDAVVTNCIITDMNLNVMEASYFDMFHSRKGFLKNIYRSSYLGCCVAFKKELLQRIIPFPADLLLYHDWWIGFFIDFSEHVEFIRTPCMYFRRHMSNVTNTTGNSNLSVIQKIYYRLQLIILGYLRLFKFI